MRYVYELFSTVGRFTATEQTYHSPTSVCFQNERIVGGGCHYCGSTRSQVGLACAPATFNTGMFMIKLLPEHKIVYNSTKLFIDLSLIILLSKCTRLMH